MDRFYQTEFAVHVFMFHCFQEISTIPYSQYIHAHNVL
jgi:hypothetical protein